MVVRQCLSRHSRQRRGDRSRGLFRSLVGKEKHGARDRHQRDVGRGPQCGAIGVREPAAPPFSAWPTNTGLPDAARSLA